MISQFQQLREIIKVRGLYQKVFAGPEGQAVLLHILRCNFVHQSTFVGGDPQQTSLHEGQRRAALSIARLAQQNIEPLIRKLNEMQNENPTE